MTELCRAALWYSDHVEIVDTKLHGIKALRECSDVVIRNCDIISPEFGWSVRGIRMEATTAVSEYFMMRSENLIFRIGEEGYDQALRMLIYGVVTQIM